MVGVSSNLPAMDLKRPTVSDQTLSSPRTKVVSRFGLGIVLSFIILTVVLFNTSSKGPFINPVFQGLYNFGNTSSFRSWPFSSGFGSFRNITASECNATSNNLDKLQHPNETLEENLEKGSKSLDFDGKDRIFGSGGLGNVSEKSKDGSFFLGEGSHGMFADDVRNVSKIDNSTKILVNGSGEALGGGNLVISVENMKNESLSVKEDGRASSNGNFSINSVDSEQISNGREIGASGDGKAGNYSFNGEKVGSRNNVVKASGSNSNRDCDIFNGKWVRDDTKPHYPPGSCPYIDGDFDCHLNGRPDSDYVKWRWQPHDCDIPRFNATDFLERIRGQKLVFVGDSLNRNMWESLVCLLRHGVEDKKRVYEISGRHEFKKKGFYAFRFEDYNCSIDFVSSPFLVKESSFNGKNGSFDTLRLDLMDGTTSMYHDADVIIFNTGHWWTHEKTSRGEDYYQEGNYIHPRLKVMEAFKRALITWGKWVDNNVDIRKTQIIFRGYSVTHFRGGPWNSGGKCHKETEPIFNENHLAKYPAKMRVLEYVLKDMKTPITYLNISRLTDYRKDGHPSIYRPDYQAGQQEAAGMHAQDCSHWCLPGVPDTWNELLYVSLLKTRRGTWRD